MSIEDRASDRPAFSARGAGFRPHDRRALAFGTSRRQGFAPGRRRDQLGAALGREKPF